MDAYTLIVASSIASAIMAMTMYLLHRASPRDTALLDWALVGVFNLVSNGIGMAILSHRTASPLAPAIANVFYIAGHYGIQAGLRRHFGLAPRWNVALLLSLLILGVHFTPFAQASTVNRLILFYPIIIAIDLLTIKLLWRAPQHEAKAAYRSLLLLEIAFVLQIVSSFVFILSGDGGRRPVPEDGRLAVDLRLPVGGDDELRAGRDAPPGSGAAQGFAERQPDRLAQPARAAGHRRARVPARPACALADVLHDLRHRPLQVRQRPLWPRRRRRRHPPRDGAGGAGAARLRRPVPHRRRGIRRHHRRRAVRAIAADRRAPARADRKRTDDGQRAAADHHRQRRHGHLRTVGPALGRHPAARRRRAVLRQAGRPQPGAPLPQRPGPGAGRALALRERRLRRASRWPAASLIRAACSSAARSNHSHTTGRSPAPPCRTAPTPRARAGPDRCRRRPRAMRGGPAPSGG